jgi:hypothetical protein
MKIDVNSRLGATLKEPSLVRSEVLRESPSEK